MTTKIEKEPTMTTATWTIDLPHYSYANLRRDWLGAISYGLRWVVGVV